MNDFIPHIISGGTVTLFVPNKGITPVNSDHPNYQAIVDNLEAGEFDAVLPLLDIPQTIVEATSGYIEVINGEVLYKQKPIHGVFVERLLRLMAETKPVAYLLMFLDNLMQNPSMSARNELPLFLVHGDIPLTDDGHFLAFKYVGQDLRSIHASPDGTHLLHEIGTYVEMDRWEVDDNRHQTCSTGLHCCSFDYLPQYGTSTGYRVVIVKVNPRDVVAVPADYSNKKMRVARYFVQGELDVGFQKSTMGQSVVGDAEPEDFTAYEPGIDEDLTDVEEDGTNEGLVCLHAGNGQYEYTDADGDEHTVFIRADDYGDQIITIALSDNKKRVIDTFHHSEQNAFNVALATCRAQFAHH